MIYAHCGPYARTADLMQHCGPVFFVRAADLFMETSYYTHSYIPHHIVGKAL